MVNIFAVLALAGRYHDMISAQSAHLPEIEQAFNEIQAWIAKHPKLIEAIPEVQVAIVEFEAILDKHKALIGDEQAWTNVMQAFIKELLPLLQ